MKNKQFVHDKNAFLLNECLENLNLLFFSLLLMIQFYIPWEGEREGGYDENLK